MRYFLIVVDDKRVNLRELWEDDLIRGWNAATGSLLLSAPTRATGQTGIRSDGLEGTRDTWQEMIISRTNVPVEGWEQVAHRLHKGSRLKELAGDLAGSEFGGGSFESLPSGATSQVHDGRPKTR